ncbi:uncharacterized protein UTRI_03405 [Ustilago trichophora]|uniref:Uncharacterized protein n=1 Tax=Ustilago trichophora TaxID=86804 RepID=A0A5C3E3F7_9BASI|nr:uncharacterized protein UTRI_03405 [Ustilago trichophora]
MTGTTEHSRLGQRSQPPSSESPNVHCNFEPQDPASSATVAKRTEKCLACMPTQQRLVVKGPEHAKPRQLEKKKKKKTECMKAIKHPNLQMGGEDDRSRSGPSSVARVKQSKPMTLDFPPKVKACNIIGLQFAFSPKAVGSKHR